MINDQYRRLFTGDEFINLTPVRRKNLINISTRLRQHSNYRESEIKNQNYIDYTIENSYFKNTINYNVSIYLLLRTLENINSLNIIVHKLLNGVITPDKLWSTEIKNFTNIHNKILDVHIKQQNQVFIQTTSTLHTCSRCKKNITIVRIVQMRSSDEGATSIFTCLNEGCGHVWYSG